MEFLIVGNNPVRRVRSLQSREGVVVMGGVEDVRPFLRSACAVVAPLRIARGIQNKVLEALAMGKRVLATPQVCETFGSERPLGVLECCSGEDFAAGREWWVPNCYDQAARAGAFDRFSWSNNMQPLVNDVGLAVANAAVSR